MPASLNDIYKSLGELTGIVRGLAEKIEDNERRNTESIKRADDSRAVVHRRLDDVVLRITHLESDMGSVKGKVEGVEKVTVAVTTLRTKAEGAGTLGYWLLRIGGVLLSAAGGFAAAYTWMTGRPPP